MARIAAPLIAPLIAVGLASCTTGSGLFGGAAAPNDSVEAAGNGSDRSRGSDNLALYLETLRSLVEGDAVVQADAFRSAEEALEASPTTSNRLNLALALATPGHPSSDPAQAQRLLNELLAAGDSLLPEERILALVHLKEVEQRLILDAEAQRLQRAVAAATAARNDQSAQRLSAALEENRQLRVELEEARAKLDAITNIERSIRERDNGSNAR